MFRKLPRGVVVEDDSAGRWMVKQIVAPAGQVWEDGGCGCMRVEWVRGDSAHRAAAITDANNRIACGLRPMTDEEREQCDE